MRVAYVLLRAWRMFALYSVEKVDGTASSLELNQRPGLMKMNAVPLIFDPHLLQEISTLWPLKKAPFLCHLVFQREMRNRSQQAHSIFELTLVSVFYNPRELSRLTEDTLPFLWMVRRCNRI